MRVLWAGRIAAQRVTKLLKHSGRRAALVVLIGTAILPAGSADEKRLAVYSAATNYSLPVADRAGRDYIGLLEVLEPLGHVSVRTDGQRWKLRFNNIDVDFTAGKNRGKVRGRDFDLAANFLLENNRGLVPISSLGGLIARILSGPVTFNEAARRLFIGNVAIHFTAQLSHTAPPRLVMNFNSPVNPTIATEPGKLHMVFRREPLVSPGSSSLTFDEKTIPSATYSENNGAAEITVSGSVPLMASFSNEGRTITVAPTPDQAVNQVPAQASAAARNTTPLASDNSLPMITISPPATPRYFYAVLDASHGGDDRGAALSGQLAEKDVTLALARRLRQELESRGISTLVLRDSDANLTLDQRAIFTNTAHPVVYISLHAASNGRGVRLYTAMLPAAGTNNGPFLDWATAQNRFLAQSETAIQGVASELQKKQIQVRMLVASLRPLNNVTAAAIAVEVAPPGTDVMDLGLPAYQQNVASGVANGIASVRDKLGAPR